MKSIVKLIAAFGASTYVFGAICIIPTTYAAENKTNIIVILADDLGYADLGFNGAKDIKTPVLDMLANTGVTFKNGYVTHPYCGPSRAGLLTGRYQARFGMENNVSYSPYDIHMGLPLTEKTFAKRLQEVGYKTAIIGKWHLGGAPRFQPNKRGFDYFYGFLGGGHNYMPHEVTIGGGSYFLPLMRNEGVAEFDDYLTSALSKDAVKFIEDHQKQPFMLYMAYNAPHTPLQAPKETIAKYKDIKDENRRIYAAMIDEMDQGIGEIVDALKRTGQYQNTLIFFLSDNGGVYPEDWMPNANWADNSPFRRGKVALLEGGIRVPFIAHWPAKIPKGFIFEGLVSSLDIAATAVEISGANASDGLLDGVNLVPYLTGLESGTPHHALYWRLEEADHIYAIRTPDAKYMRQPLPGVGRSFFDMKNDPEEQNNIVDTKLMAQSEMARLWNQWNSQNMNNVLLQSWEYSEVRNQFYDELFRQNKQDAISRETYVIE
ncbi:sulfatase family protein [Agaribacter marinus]|uniref:N-acetylgalactosamine-6-sulfatase n=1 Tax=Agaribacter marinus TaxID=1431249 RepID=A0AA37SY24_9ALTE|nr:sulfatase-like hydrolase/transferase [Agaribacter marinus]GLR70359.1 N-acetylgalactosamine-6-sulfatase [Agaribacter marinus]